MILAAVSSLILIIPLSTMTLDDGMLTRVYRPKIALERNLPMLDDDSDDRRDLTSTISVEEEERSTVTIFATRT